MRATVTPLRGSRTGTYVVLETALPGRARCGIGVILVDAERDRGWLRMRRDFAEIAEPEDAEVLEALEEDIRARLAESGAEAFLGSLEDTLSNAVRISERQTVAVDAFSRVVEQLFQEHVRAVEVQRFRTHVPLYSLRAAAGGLGEEMESLAEDWIPAP